MYSVRGQGRRRRATLVAGAAMATMLLLTGCQGDTEPDAGGATTIQGTPSGSPAAVAATTPSNPEPSPASSAGPAANIPVPEKPALADENSEEGLEAFTEYWFELLSYSYLTNDWSVFDEETDPGCRTCASIRTSVSELYNQGRWLAGAEVDLVSFDTTFEMTTSGSITSYVENRQNEISYFDTDGYVLRTVPQQAEPALDVINTIFEEGRWVVLDYGAPEGTK